MSLLTYLTQAEITSSAREIDGKVLTRPSLLVTDGTNLIYAVDVDIGLGAPVKNVPIARGNRDLMYADVGNAARLRRTASGQYEVVGFSKELPGSYTSICVHLNSAALGAITDRTLSSHIVALGELQDFGAGFGSTPLEAIAMYQGSTLLELRI